MRNNAFTLVELLVVVAIITILAAMLLPTLEKSLEMARRIHCANNQHQLYISASSYADEWGDALPYHTTLPSWSDIDNGFIYWVAANTPFRHFLGKYAGTSIAINATNDAGAFASNPDIAHCPSAKYKSAAWKQRSDYGFPGFGHYWSAADIQSYGTTRMCQAGQASRAPANATITNPVTAPKTFIMDATYSTVPTAAELGELAGKNHGFAGGNATMGDGSCGWILDANWGIFGGYGMTRRPATSYTQAAQITSGFLGLSYPPAGKVFNMTGASLAEMHRMYGYRGGN